MDENRKVTHNHLNRQAYLYVRQSSIKQVIGNQESTKRQYGLRDRAIILGWPSESITTIDDDQGQSGAESIHRQGFQKLVADVGMGKAGIVMGLEVSRLARNSMDWHRLLEICALTNTLILDEDGIYDPGYFNDRLLLGLKGTMSEAELHILKARLRGGVLNKARRGELKLGLPVGFVYDCNDRVVLHPDKQVRESISLLFEVFEKVGTAHGVVKYFRTNRLKFPRKVNKVIDKKKIIWGTLMHNQVLRILHNPRFAGIFYYGRTQACITPKKKYQKKIKDKNHWHVFLPNMHVGYIAQEQYELNQKRLLENAQAYKAKHRKTPPREGPALIQGMVICGICGSRMTVRYYNRKDELVPDYVCQKESIEYGEKICQRIPGKSIDKAIGELLLKKMTPLDLEITIAVQKEIETQAKQIQNMHKKDVDRAKYEADLARRRYMNVDPGNRMVADSLESEWNEKLLILKDVQEEYENYCKKSNVGLTAEQKEEIMQLAESFPRLWKDQSIPYKERKRIVRLMIEDVTLVRNKRIIIHIRFTGGVNETLYLPLPLSHFMEKKTKPEVVKKLMKC